MTWPPRKDKELFALSLSAGVDERNEFLPRIVKGLEMMQKG
jgi:hypothetical protein